MRVELVVAALRGLWDFIAAHLRERPRLKLTVRVENARQFFIAMGDGPIHASPPGRDVKVRVVNTGRAPIEIERVGLEVEDGELIELEGGDRLPHILHRPELPNAIRTVTPSFDGLGSDACRVSSRSEPMERCIASLSRRSGNDRRIGRSRTWLVS
jgi:hypothetical protein